MTLMEAFENLRGGEISRIREILGMEEIDKLKKTISFLLDAIKNEKHGPIKRLLDQGYTLEVSKNCLSFKEVK